MAEAVHSTDYSPHFVCAVDAVIRHEGGGMVHRVLGDRGGTTKWGVSQRAYPQVDIETLSREEAVEIYHRDYWVAVGCPMFKSVALQLRVFDLAVNVGVEQAGKLLQNALGDSGCAVLVDGKVGPHTVAAVGRADCCRLIASLVAGAAAYYGRVVVKDRTQMKFLQGWLNRLGRW